MTLYNPYGSTAPVTYGMLLYQLDGLRNHVKGIYDSLNFALQNNSSIINNNISNSTGIILSRISTVLGAISTSTNAIQKSFIDAINTSNNGLKSQITSVTQNINSNIINASNNIMIDARLQSGQIITRLNDSMLALSNFIASGDRAIIEQLKMINSGVTIDYDTIYSRISASQNIIISYIANAVTLSQNNILTGLTNKTNEITGKILSVDNNIITKINTQTKELSAQLQSIDTSIATLQSSQPVVQESANILDPLNKMLSEITIFSDVFNTLTGDIGKSFDKINSILHKLEYNEYTDYKQFQDDLNGLGIAGNLTGSLWNFGKMLFVFTYGLISSYQPFIENIQTLSQSQANNTLLNVADIIRYFHKSNRPIEFIEKYLNKLGYSDSDISILRINSFNLLDESIARFAWLQDKIDENTHDKILESLGYSDQSINIIKRTYFGTPSAQDLITMAVREAFTPEIAKIYGQYENYPEILTEYMRKNGIDEQWAKAYWASHWNLPSPQQGFEMFHRGIIKDKDELKDLLRALDIMPYWRDKLIQLNYDVLRLVDIRRFYQLGVIDEAQMFKEYKARGYDDERAQWATEYTIKSTSEGSEIEAANKRLLSQTVIVKAYKTGRINHSDAIFALKELKYTEQDAQLLLDIAGTNDAIDNEEKVIDDNRKRLIKLATDGYAKRVINLEDVKEMLLNNGYTSEQVNIELGMTDYEVMELRKAKLVNFISDLYLTYQIDNNNMSVLMSSFGFENSEIDRLINELNTQKELRGNLPSLDTFRRWLKSDIIDVPFFVNGLKGLGYADNYIDVYVFEIKGTVQ